METTTHAPGDLETFPSLGSTVTSWHILLLNKSTVRVSVTQPSLVTTSLLSGAVLGERISCFANKEVPRLSRKVEIHYHRYKREQCLR